MFSTWTVRVVLTLSLVRLPVALSLVTFLTVLARTLSPSWIRLKACHMSSASSGTSAATPAPSLSRDLWTSFILLRADLKSFCVATHYFITYCFIL